ncbi:MAG TPA: hypothetical protein VKO84_12355 [Gaiellaceae bacterium]|nr:hypothetical protein [Gaiellaceae bacterium]
MLTRIVGLGAVVAAALVAASVVLAGNPAKEKIAFTAAGQAHAKAQVLRRADLGAGWKGGFVKPDLTSSMPCTSYRPKQSDLVLIGASETTFAKPGLEVDTEAQVLESPAMVRRDWQRTVLAAQVIPCLRVGLVKALGSKAKLVSFRKVAFPHMLTLTQGFRLVANVTTQSGLVPVEIDFVAMGSGRNEITLTLSGLAAARASIHAAEVHLARVLAARVRP